MAHRRARFSHFPEQTHSEWLFMHGRAFIQELHARALYERCPGVYPLGISIDFGKHVALNGVWHPFPKSKCLLSVGKGYWNDLNTWDVSHTT